MCRLYSEFGTAPLGVIFLLKLSILYNNARNEIVHTLEVYEMPVVPLRDRVKINWEQSGVMHQCQRFLEIKFIV